MNFTTKNNAASSLSDTRKRLFKDYILEVRRYMSKSLNLEYFLKLDENINTNVTDYTTEGNGYDWIDIYDRVYGELIGFIVFEHQKGNIELLHIYVKSSYRNKKYAQNAMMEYFKTHSAKYIFTTLLLQARPFVSFANKFFTRIMGYTERRVMPVPEYIVPSECKEVYYELKMQ